MDEEPLISSFEDDMGDFIVSDDHIDYISSQSSSTQHEEQIASDESKEDSLETELDKKTSATGFYVGCNSLMLCRATLAFLKDLQSTRRICYLSTVRNKCLCGF